MFILGKHKTDLGDNLNIYFFFANSENHIFQDAIQKKLLEFPSEQF